MDESGDPWWATYAGKTFNFHILSQQALLVNMSRVGV